MYQPTDVDHELRREWTEIVSSCVAGQPPDQEWADFWPVVMERLRTAKNGELAPLSVYLDGLDAQTQQSALTADAEAEKFLRKRLLATRDDQLSAAYSTLYLPAEGDRRRKGDQDLVFTQNQWKAAARSQVSDLAWVTTAQRDALAAVVAKRGLLATWLPAELDKAWSQWRESTAEQLVPWLDGWIPTLVAAAAPPVTELGWVTERQRAALAGRGPLAGWLPGELDKAWARWRESTAEQLATWLDGWLPTLLAAAPAPEQQSPTTPEKSTTDVPEEPDPWKLGWVTESQRTQLDELVEVRGDWHEWLPIELTNRIGPDWPQLRSAELVSLLDDFVGLLNLPYADMFEEIDQFMDDVAAKAVEKGLGDYFENTPPEKIEADWDAAMSRLPQ